MINATRDLILWSLISDSWSFWSVDAAQEDGSFGRLVNNDHKHPNCKMQTPLCSEGHQCRRRNNVWLCGNWLAKTKQVCPNWAAECPSVEERLLIVQIGIQVNIRTWQNVFPSSDFDYFRFCLVQGGIAVCLTICYFLFYLGKCCANKYSTV